MPRSNVTIYDLLISCPGDVTEEIDIIKKVVEVFNRTFGLLNSIRIEAKHWSRDSYPQSGGKPQELLNKQFVLDCDAAVVIFWARFGTPTDQYQSGTEEEIEAMLTMGKQVFMYFSDKTINPSNIDNAQHEKVKAFREKYKDKGIYSCYGNNNEFEKLFLNHLSKYFLGLITNTGVDTTTASPPNLIMQGLQDGKPQDILYARRGTKWPIRWISSIESKIEALLKEISEIELSTPEIVDKPSSDIITNIGPNYSLQAIVNLQKNPGTELRFLNSNMINASVPESTKEVILKYLQKAGHGCPPALFDLGNLREISGQLVSPFGGSAPRLEGTEDEKKKYEKLRDLGIAVDEYQQITKYFPELDKLFVAPCVISNVGKSFDEDVDVKVRFSHDCICKVADFPVPGNKIIKLLQNMEVISTIFSVAESVDVEAFSNYPNVHFIPYPPLRKSAKEEYEESLQEYTRNLETLFCYRYFEDSNGLVIKFNIPYLKQNTSMSFPSLLYLKMLPKSVEYEIRSKHYPDVVTGTLGIKEC